MKMIEVAILMGLGYCVRDAKDRKDKGGRYYRGRSNLYGKDGHIQQTFKEYFHELAINKLDILFYGSEVHKNKKVNFKYSRPYSFITIDTMYNAIKDLLCFSTYSEAITKMNEILDLAQEHDVVTVSDILIMFGDPYLENKFTYTKYGWNKSALTSMYIKDKDKELGKNFYISMPPIQQL